METLTVLQKQSIKLAAQQIYQYSDRIAMLREHIASIEKQIKEYEDIQEDLGALCYKWTGYKPTDLIDRIFKETDRKDKDGESIKLKVFAFRYPDTIVPPVTDEEIAEYATEEDFPIEVQTTDIDTSNPAVEPTIEE